MTMDGSVDSGGSPGPPPFITTRVVAAAFCATSCCTATFSCDELPAEGLLLLTLLTLHMRAGSFWEVAFRSLITSFAKLFECFNILSTNWLRFG
ncbi:hypothetical protein M404DRAFT_841067 [Pisolithus tinctorius Marx 270]|uniref:Uncharacterized protein n=1 Tax=Pisolithus tinctorius Marx 270 TaxID=870435 RepID=A0A0C3JQ97_PISTI|nr:hypothetical protein M404DRAFT_841067 [Pisolithus tinctorius Marx 270]